MDKLLRNTLSVGLLFPFLLTLGCSGDMGPRRQETFPVTGEVLVDGQPAGNLAVELHDAKKLGSSNSITGTAYTDEQGKFSISTYEAADGAPEGEYVATFMWGQLDMFKNQYGGPDKLKSKYNDSQKSTFKIKVEKGKPAVMGKVELSTK